MYIRSHLDANKDEKRKYDLGSLSNKRGFSVEIIEDLMSSGQGDFKNIKYKFYRRLVILGLIFDLQLKPSLSIVHENNYVEKICSDISKHEEIEKIKKHCERYIENKVRGNFNYGE